MTKRHISNHHVVSRRKVLDLGFLGASAFALGAIQSASFANGTASSGACAILIKTLRSTGKEVCILAADKLEAEAASGAPVSLHLRNAGLQVADAEALATAFTGYSSDNSQRIWSFSVSYNPLLGDQGAIALARSLPHTVSEIGFVGCAIGDVGGEALLQWGTRASRPSMICVEGNRFSAATKRRFRELAKEKPGLLVVV